MGRRLKLHHLYRKKSVAAALALLSAACATSSVTLTSSPPKAEIYVAPLGAGKPKLIGETPLTMRADELQKEYGGSGPVYIEFRKNGYTPAKTVVTELASVDLTVSAELDATSGLEDLERLNLVVDDIFEAQRLARGGRYDDALTRVKSVEKLAPMLAASYELEGGIYYLQKKYKDALDSYTLAAKYNPRNSESVRMRNMLETTLGAKSKAGSVTNAAAAPSAQSGAPAAAGGKTQ
jgi:tetratricopeptide (TPR) repeat protein